MEQTARARPEPATYADIEALPDNVVGEILGGELVVSPRPRPRHSRASSILGAVVIGPFDLGTGGPGGWWILDEVELHIAGEILVPDLAGWRVERLPELPDDVGIDVPPDWVCEVLSPSAASTDRIRKTPSYARMGVGHLWLLDPAARTLEVFRLLDEHWWLVGTFGTEDSPVHAEPFEAVGLELDLLWGKPAPARPGPEEE